MHMQRRQEFGPVCRLSRLVRMLTHYVIPLMFLAASSCLTDKGPPPPGASPPAEIGSPAAGDTPAAVGNSYIDPSEQPGDGSGPPLDLEGEQLCSSPDSFVAGPKGLVEAAPPKYSTPPADPHPPGGPAEIGMPPIFSVALWLPDCGRRGQPVDLTLSVTNVSESSVTAGLSEHCAGDFQVENTSGEMIWGWREQRVLRHYRCPLTELKVEWLPAETKTFEATWNLDDNEGLPLPSGEYRLVGRLGITWYAQDFPTGEVTRVISTHPVPLRIIDGTGVPG